MKRRKLLVGREERKKETSHEQSKGEREKRKEKWKNKEKSNKMRKGRANDRRTNLKKKGKKGNKREKEKEKYSEMEDGNIGNGKMERYNGLRNVEGRSKNYIGKVKI